MDLRIKSKFINVKKLNPESCYQDSSDSDSHGQSSVSEQKQNNNSKEPIIDLEKQRERRKNANQLIIESYKKWIKRLDLLITVIAFLTCILAQIENEEFFTFNKNYRSLQINVINFMRSNLITNKNTSSQLIDHNKYVQLNNTFNVTPEYILTYTNFEMVEIDLQISLFGSYLRIIISILSICTVPLICVSQYYEFIKEIEYQEKLDISFFKTKFCFFLILEVLIMLLFQYPKLNSYLLEIELDNCIVMPYSTALSTLTFLRIYFVTKLIKHLTKWTSSESEQVCENYVCKANIVFAFKAFQKENPFVALVLIFILTCLCFGLALRSFELYFWETQSPDAWNFQNWGYFWNSLWCIFVSMTTVGYGDFYPKTQVGRCLSIFACMIGVYFVSMMMVFMNQASDLNTNEYKAFKLVTRLMKRKEIKNLQAKMIHHALLMSINKIKYDSGEDDVVQSKKNYMYEKRNITSSIEEIKQKLLIIKGFDITPTQEHLLDISERIKQNMSEIKDHLDTLSFINETLLNFTDSQIEIAKYLKNNCYATKLLYSVIEKKRLFGKLNNLDFSLKDVFEQDLDKNEDSNKFYDSTKATLNPQDPCLFNDNHEENILGNKINLDEIRSHFDIIFSKDKLFVLRNEKKVPTKKGTAKTLMLLDIYKQNNEKFKKLNTTSKMKKQIEDEK